MSQASQPIADLEPALGELRPVLDPLREAAGGQPLYLVGGAVRDLLLGLERSDLDVVVEGDARALARRVGADIIEHERFATAKAQVGGTEVDIASARAESYPSPGALPEVRPAGLDEDLARRDFTINAMAVPLQGDPALIDPHGGRDDLQAGLLRVLHPGSFSDDPTRALRAARYAARFGLELAGDTEGLLRGTDLETVSADRRQAELLRAVAEPQAVLALELLEEWGLVRLRDDAPSLSEVDALVSAAPWSEVAIREAALLAAALGPPGREHELAAARPERPSEAVELARGAASEELVLARALGGEWLDEYVRDWRSVVLEIGGQDLISAGIPEGPAVGRGLSAALRAKLDGEVSGRQQELDLALAEARDALG